MSFYYYYYYCYCYYTTISNSIRLYTELRALLLHQPTHDY